MERAGGCVADMMPPREGARGFGVAAGDLVSVISALDRSEDDRDALGGAASGQPKPCLSFSRYRSRITRRLSLLLNAPAPPAPSPSEAWLGDSLSEDSVVVVVAPGLGRLRLLTSGEVTPAAVGEWIAGEWVVAICAAGGGGGGGV